MAPPASTRSHRDLLPGSIRGITRTSLWNAWKAIRKEVRNSSIRDIVDFLDFDINPDVWIDRLLARIASGRYEPETPNRFTLGKSKGFVRTMTLPAIPDLVLYRAIVEYIYARSRRRKHKNVYFLRDELTQAQKKALDDALGRMESASDIEVVDGGYRFTGKKSFYNWLRFNQYRNYLIYEDIHPFIVITDIANFFDTVLHSHVAQAVQSLPVPPRMVGLLFYLLEHLSIRQDFTSSHGISLPTDEFDCSRTLAHMVLFPHDDGIVQLVGEDRYVRWMDDQNMAVNSKAAGLLVLQEVGKSLGRLHLTPSSQKSRILSLAEARRHYHLDLNDELDQAEVLSQKATKSKRAKLRFQRSVRRIWHTECAPAGALLALRFGGTGLRALLKRCYEDKRQKGSTAIVRASAFVYASHSDQSFDQVRLVAGSVLRNHLSTLVRLIEEIRRYAAVPARYGQRMSLSTDSVAGLQFVDMRVFLTARLLLLNPSKPVRDWVINWRIRQSKRASRISTDECCDASNELVLRSGALRSLQMVALSGAPSAKDPT